jgi:hypothetical protein
VKAGKKTQQRVLINWEHLTYEKSNSKTLPEPVGAIMINRSALIIRVKQPFLAWVKSLPDHADVALEEVNQDNTVYLLSDSSYYDDLDDILGQFYNLIFEDQLSGWWTDVADWPPNRDLAVFKEWFGVEFHSSVLDLVDAPLEDDK